MSFVVVLVALVFVSVVTEAKETVLWVTPSVDMEYEEHDDEEFDDDDDDDVQEEQEEDTDSADEYALLRLLVSVESPIDSLSKLLLLLLLLYNVEGDIGIRSRRLLVFFDEDRYHWNEYLTGLLL
jgi:hypothetical protein